jgi:hypothetical protein
MQKFNQLQLELDLKMPLCIPEKLGISHRTRRSRSQTFGCLCAQYDRVVPIVFRPTRFWQVAIIRRQRLRAGNFTPLFAV